MRHPPNLDGAAQSIYLPHIGLVRLKVDFSDGPVQTLRNSVVGEPCVLDHLAGQRVAVGVQTAGRQADYGVAWLYLLTADYLAPFARPYAHADDLEVSLAVDTRHLSGLAAYERDPELPAGFCSAADYAGDGFGIQPAAGHVVEEEERTRTRGEHVVGAVVDDICA